MTSSLKEPLKPKDIESHSRSGPFRVTKEELMDLFLPDKIRDGESLQGLEKIGGVEGLAKALDTNLKLGIDISQSSLQQRTNAQEIFASNPFEILYFFVSMLPNRFGHNEELAKPPKTLWELVVGCFEEDILKLLCAAAFVSLIIGCINEGIAEGWLEGMAIFIAVILIVSVTSINDYMKEKQFRKLNSQAAQRDVGVFRNGEIVHISIFSLLVGDIVQVETGEIFPVDGLLLKGNNLVCDESSITGETDPVKKFAPSKDAEEVVRPFLISGSKVIEGSGEMMVLAVGENSSVGKQKLMMQEDDDDKKTPLQAKLDVLVDQIGKIGLYCAIFTFAAMVINLIISSSQNEEELFTLENLQEVVGYFIIGVTIIVVAIPEGLPLAVTIALAYAVGKMKDEQNLVRTLDSCETMGGADTICSDKTGTLTQNKMKVTRLFAMGEVRTVFEKKDFITSFLDVLCEGLCVNSNAFPTIDKKGKFEQNGNKTECSLIELAYEFDYNYKKYRPSDNILKVIPFSSARKRMTSVYQSEKSVRVFSKGAPDILIDMCKRYVNKNGQVEPLNDNFLLELKKKQKAFSDDSLRTLLITYKEITLGKDKVIPSDQDLESDLIVIGLAGIQDPLRPGIANAVKTCKKAGVTVRMVTGDNLDTAVAISKEAGIIDKDFNLQDNMYTVMEGKHFRQKVGGLIVRQVENEGKMERKYDVGNIEVFREIKSHLRVLARSTPDDKFLLVTGLQKCGSVVAVTGDGTNDAPALKKADIGFAMGIAGTEVAKEAAGIILVDDNFSSTITAIKWGRNIFDCIRKFLQFQLTVNVVAMFMAFMGGVILRESPLNSIQMLWVNLIMDTLASLALATEPPSDELLDRVPVKRHELMITQSMWKTILIHSLYQIGVLTVVLFYGPDIFGVEYGINVKKWDNLNGIHLTMFFNIFVYLQLFNEINARKLKQSEFNVFKGFFNNPLFLFVLVATVVVQMTLVEYGGRAVKCSPLTTDQNIQCLLIGASSLVVGFLIKLLPSSIDNVLNKINPFHRDGAAETAQEPSGGITEVLQRPSLLKARNSQRSSTKQNNAARNSQKNLKQDNSINKPIELSDLSKQ